MPFSSRNDVTRNIKSICRNVVSGFQYFVDFRYDLSRLDVRVYILSMKLLFHLFESVSKYFQSVFSVILKLTASTLVAHVGKTPNIAQTHRVANAGQDKLHFIGPMLLARLQMGRLVGHVHVAVIVIDAQRPVDIRQVKQA